jgi:hypothetical protein
LKRPDQQGTMIKDIVVNLSVSERQGHPAEDYAISMASALGAHVTGIAFIYDAYIPLVYPLMSYGEAPAEVKDALKREKVALAKEAADRFAKATSLAGVAAELLTLGTTFAGSVDQFGRIARRFDLAIIGQVEPQTNAYESNIAEGALFGSGRPMIIVPYIQKAPFKLDRVMACWDGSAPSPTPCRYSNGPDASNWSPSPKSAASKTTWKAPTWAGIWPDAGLRWMSSAL